ncbi:GTP pyrophosphokinase family protein [Streptomyces sp. SAS_281]|uniref:GTP pyrophosphokinase n=1 Tax=Streptomyces sp. SAS_281 TaxID=3412744 RepID=UPI00403C26D2
MNAEGLSEASYAASTSRLEGYGQVVCGLLKHLIAEAGIMVQSVEYRVKTWRSAQTKVEAAPDKYTGYGSLTDLLGVRVITYFDDEVDLISELIEREFEIDEANSVDKRALLDPDRFGYLSRHYILSLDPRRESLIEYRQYKGLGFELQVRSLLQHAWAEIEHDLGYKSKGSLPKATRRQFYRLAGLLEMADEQFRQLRDAHQSYSEEVHSKIDASQMDLPLDQLTIQSFLETNATALSIDKMLATKLRTTELHYHAEYAWRQVAKLMDFGAVTVQDLAQDLESNRERIEIFSDHWITDTGGHKALSRGLCLYYLLLLKISQLKRGEMDLFVSELARRYRGMVFSEEQKKRLREIGELMQ